MTDARRSLLVSAIAAAALATAAAAQAQCVGAGVITRIEGQPTDVAVRRGGADVNRIRILEVLCEGDVVSVRGPATVTLSIGSQGPVRVSQGGSYTVQGRSARPSLASNAYLSVTDHVLKDMKRQPWEVRLRGGEPPLSWGVEGLGTGGQQLLAGQRDVLVRVVGGRPDYTVTLTGPNGAPVAGGDGSGEVVLRGVVLAPGSYRLQARDGAGATIDGGFTVAGQPSVSSAYEGIDDAEVRAAVAAADLARSAPGVWAFESEQMLNAAPRASLDRDSVYRLIESYGGGG